MSDARVSRRSLPVAIKQAEAQDLAAESEFEDLKRIGKALQLERAAASAVVQREVERLTNAPDAQWILMDPKVGGHIQWELPDEIREGRSDFAAWSYICQENGHIRLRAQNSRYELFDPVTNKPAVLNETASMALLRYHGLGSEISQNDNEKFHVDAHSVSRAMETVGERILRGDPHLTLGPGGKVSGGAGVVKATRSVQSEHSTYDFREAPEVSLVLTADHKLYAELKHPESFEGWQRVYEMVDTTENKE
jgi:hypothetical protein